MTEPKPTPQQNPTSPDSSDETPSSQDETSGKTGFFNRVQRELKPKPVHPSEAEEIVIMDDLKTNERT